jgi:hypothetical protein
VTGRVPSSTVESGFAISNLSLLPDREELLMKCLTNLVTYGVFCAIAILPAAAQQHLYVGDDNVAGGVQQYTIPVSNASTPNFKVAANSVLSMAINAAGGMAVGELGGNLQFFNAPLSGASVPRRRSQTREPRATARSSSSLRETSSPRRPAPK